MNNLTISSPVNFDVKEQKFNGQQKAIAIAGDYNGTSAIGEYTNIPLTGSNILVSQNGNLSFIPIPSSGNYIIVSQNGTISTVQAPAGNLQLLNNNLGWTSTTNCP